MKDKSAFLGHGYRVLTNNQNHRTKENQPSRTSQTGPEAVPPTDMQAVPYERRFSLLLRFWKLLISPSEAMRDIALAPDYIGPTFIIVLEVIVAAIAIWGTMQKFNLIGSSQYISTVWGFVGAIIAVAVVISGFIMIARWLIKSLIIKHACDSGSGWAFKTAVAVTGYAYLPDLIFAIIGSVVVFYAVPQLTLDISNLEAARQSLANFSAQLSWLKWLYTLPLMLMSVLWKSYLGGLGTRFGTKEHCSLNKAFAIFFALGLLGLIGFLFGFVYRA